MSTSVRLNLTNGQALHAAHKSQLENHRKIMNGIHGFLPGHVNHFVTSRINEELGGINM